jgi:hypothetical protein
VSVVVVDVVVRDRERRHRRGLTADDFEVREDNRPQQIRSFDFEEVTTTAPAPPPPALLPTRRSRTPLRPAAGAPGGAAAPRGSWLAAGWSCCSSI